MRRAIAIVLVAAIVLAVAWWIAALPGHVDLSVGPYAISTAAPVAILGLIVLVIVLYIVLRAIGAILRAPRQARRARIAQRRRAGDKAVTRTLVAIASGDRGDARQSAARARKMLGDTPQTLLIAAEAERLNDNQEQAAALYRLLAQRDDAAFLGLRGLFRQALAREDWSEATAIARQAEQARPGGSWLREEREMLAVRTGNWSQALTLAGPDASTVSYAVAAAEQASDPSEAMRIAKQAYKDVPTFVPAALVYARLLRAEGREGRAQEVLRSTWATNPHPDLADMLLAPIPAKTERIAEGWRLVGSNPDHVESRLLLARLTLDDDRFDDARRHIEAAHAAGCNDKRLWMLLADLETDERGNTEPGRTAVRDALRHAATADSDPAWRCEACGTVQPHWQAACPACHTPGRIRWGHQSRPSTPAPMLAIPADTASPVLP